MDEPPLQPVIRGLRPATAADSDVLGSMRAAQQSEIMGVFEDGEVASFASACRAFFAAELVAADPWVFAWLADVAGTAAGVSVLTLAPGMPRFGSPGAGPDGRIRNVYVAPQFRRRGVGRALTLAAIAAAEEMGVSRLVLGASDDGRSLYEALGFVAKDDEMVYERPLGARG